jgi:hypothetical protein
VEKILITAALRGEKGAVFVSKRRRKSWRVASTRSF